VTKATLMASTVIRQARLVSVGSPAPTGEPVDIRIKDGVVVAVATGLRPEGGEQVIDAAGRWAIPGLTTRSRLRPTPAPRPRTCADASGCDPGGWPRDSPGDLIPGAQVTRSDRATSQTLVSPEASPLKRRAEGSGPTRDSHLIDERALHSI
jgi:hypothetical protein